MAVSDRLAGRRVKCVHCGEIVDTAPGAPAPSPAPAPRPVAQVSCPFCSSRIAPGLSACPYCNENLLRRAAPGPAPVKPRPHRRRCTACAEEINAHDTVCPYCGTAAGRFSAHRTAQTLTVPWEDEPQAGFFSRWWRTWAASMFQPDAFFRAVRYQGDFQKPLGYVMGFVWQVLGLALVCGGPILALLMMSPDAMRTDSGREIPGAFVLGIALLYVVMFIGGTALGTFISAGVYHVCALMLGGRGAYEASYRAVCYSWGAAVFGFVPVPYANALLQIVFHFIALTHGLAYAHGISKGRAFAAALLPILVCCGGFVVMLTVAIGGARPIH